jgi:hypothetical protein
VDCWVADQMAPGEQGRGQSRGARPGPPTDAGAGRDRQPGRDLTLSSVRGYESRVLKVLKVKKEIQANQARPVGLEARRQPHGVAPDEIRRPIR